MALPEDDVEEVDPEPRARRGSSTTSTTRWSSDRACGPGWPRPSWSASSSPPGEPTAPPIVLDAEALRSLATMDDVVGGDAPAGRPDAARRRVRPAPGRQRPRPGRATATSWPTTPRASAAARTPRRVGPGRRPQGRGDGHRGAGRLGRDRAVREPGPRDAAARATCSRARSARCSPRASTPFDAARLGVYLHGLAGRRGRASGSAMPALLASDLPDGLAIARKRLRPPRSAARRQAPGVRARTGGRSGPRRGREPAAPRPASTRTGLSRRRAERHRTRDPSRSGWPPPACRRCRGPRGWSSTSTRSRRTSPRSARARRARRRRSSPVVKADAYGHGAVPVARALVAAGADGLCVATLDEALALRAGGSRAPSSCCTRSRPPGAPDAAASRHRDRRRATAGCWPRRSAALRPGRRPARDACGSRSRSRRVSDAAAFDPAAIVAAARPSARAGDVASAACGRTSQAPEDAERTAGQLGRFEDAAATLRGPPGSAAGPPCRGERRRS